MGRGLGGGWKAGHRPGSREERAGGLGSPGNVDSWYGWRSEECLATDMIVKVFFFLTYEMKPLLQSSYCVQSPVSTGWCGLLFYGHVCARAHTHVLWVKMLFKKKQNPVCPIRSLFPSVHSDLIP